MAGPDNTGMGGPGSIPQIRDFLDRVIAAWGLELEFKLRPEEDRIVVELDGADRDLLLERRGDLLDALQVIISKILPRRFGTTDRVVVDCGGYRLGREQEIVEIARRMAEKVKKLGAPCELSPMNPYERRLVHLALRDDSGVMTESDGDGFMKRIRISINIGRTTT